jgi:predicted Zn-dependent protease
MDTNEKVLRIVGGSSLRPEQEFELGDDVVAQVEGSVIKIEEKDNQDGTKDRIFIIKQISVEIK